MDGISYLCAEHVRQLGGVSPLHNLVEADDMGVAYEVGKTKTTTNNS